MKNILSVLVVVLFSSFAFADEVAAPGSTIKAQTPAEAAPSPVIWSGGLKSFNDTGRYSDGNGRQLKSKNEYFAGAKSRSGWGGQIMFVENATQYIKSEKNRFSPGDPSVSLLHPIYTDGDLRVSGQFKEYFPVSDFSQNRNQYLQTYYLTVTNKLAGGYDFFNQWIPRYFSQTKYDKTDTTFYMEDYTSVSKVLSDSVRLGIGQHAQMESHKDSATGSTIEVYPYADFMLSKTIFAGPRVYLPVWTQNTVFDAPKGVSTANVQAELYLQATL